MKKSSSVTEHTITLSRNAAQYVVDKRTPCNTVEWEGLGRGKLPDVDISQRSAEHVGHNITTKKFNSF
jgi:hypothetical protein